MPSASSDSNGNQPLNHFFRNNGGIVWGFHSQLLQRLDDIHIASSAGQDPRYPPDCKLNQICRRLAADFAACASRLRSPYQHVAPPSDANTGTPGIVNRVPGQRLHIDHPFVTDTEISITSVAQSTDFHRIVHIDAIIHGACIRSLSDETTVTRMPFSGLQCVNAIRSSASYPSISGKVP